MQQRSRESILDELGKAKISTTKRRGQQSEGSEIQQWVRKISRAVIRHPSEKILHQLYMLHGKLKSVFLPMSDEGISWLLSATENTRGGFRSTDYENAAQKFRAFLTKDPHTISPQKLITSIENIATAMAYRQIAATWTKFPFSPQTVEQYKISELLQQIVNPNLVEPIDQIYDRSGDKVEDELTTEVDTNFARLLRSLHPEIEEGNERKKKQESVIGQTDDVSSTSDDGDSKKIAVKHREKLDSFKYSKYFEIKDDKEKKLTWAGAANESNIHLRAHVSGSAPLTLAAIEGLFNLQTKDAKQEKWFKNDENAKSFSAVLIIATYLRADFHTIAESLAGIEYFLNARISRASSPIQPHQAFASALQLLAHGASERIVLKGNEDQNNIDVNLKEIIAAITPSVMKLTKRIDAHAFTSLNIDSDHPYRQLNDKDLISATTLFAYLEEFPLWPYNFVNQQDKLKSSLPAHIKSTNEFLKLLKFTHPSLNEDIFKIFAGKFPSIETIKDFTILMSFGSNFVRKQLYRNYKDQLISLIKNVFDFEEIMKPLTYDQRIEVYEILKQTKKLPLPETDEAKTTPDLYQPKGYRRESLGNLLAFLPIEQCEELCHNLTKQIPQFIKTERDVVTIFHPLDPLRCQTVFFIYLDYFLGLIESASKLEIVLKNLNSHQRNLIWQKLSDRLPKIIKTLDDFIMVIKYHESEKRDDVFQNLKILLPTIIEHASVLNKYEYDKVLNEKQKYEVYNIIASTTPLVGSFIDFLRTKGFNQSLNIINCLEHKNCVDLLPIAQCRPQKVSFSFFDTYCNPFIALILAIKTQNIEEIRKEMKNRSELPSEIINFAKESNNEEILKIFEKTKNYTFNRGY